MDKIPSTTTKKPTLRKLTDKEKADITKHITKNNLDTSAARKLRFAQMKSPEGSTVRKTINSLNKATTKEQPTKK